MANARFDEKNMAQLRRLAEHNLLIPTYTRKRFTDAEINEAKRRHEEIKKNQPQTTVSDNLLTMFNQQTPRTRSTAKSTEQTKLQTQNSEFDDCCYNSCLPF